MNATTPTTPRFLLALAVLAATIGLASSAVTGQFFIVGLQSMETSASTALIAAGLLMIAAEIAAFFIAAVLPNGHPLRFPLLSAGVLLVAFEIVTVFATQHAIVQTSTAAQTASTARISYLRTSIAQAQAQSASLSITAQEQVGSRYIAQRETGSENLRIAHALQAQASTQVQELTTLLANQKSTLVDALGPTGTTAYTAARALLLTITGLIMMSAAGTLLRASQQAAETTVPPIPVPVPEGHPLPNVPVLAQTITATVPTTVPTVPNTTQTVPAMLTVPLTTAPAVPEPTIAAPEDDTVPAPGPRYNAARAAIIDGHLTQPSVRTIQALVGGSTSTARAIQACLAAEGLIERHGQGYQLTQCTQGTLL